MEFIFSPNAIRGKIYKKIFHYLYNKADTVYFTFYEDMMSNNEILELGQRCKRVSVPRRIREFFDSDVVGYEVDIFIRMYIYEHNSLYDLLRDRVYGAILFYSGNNRIIYIQLEDFDDIYIKTNDKILIKEFIDIEY